MVLKVSLHICLPKSRTLEGLFPLMLVDQLCRTKAWDLMEDSTFSLAVATLVRHDFYQRKKSLCGLNPQEIALGLGGGELSSLQLFWASSELALCMGMY